MGAAARPRSPSRPRARGLADPFLWRVSSARVEASGPFSRFPGRARALLLLEGAGLLLTIGSQGRERLKHPGQVVTFSGDEAVDAALIQGPCTDFGLIHDPRRVQATLEWLNLGREATAISWPPPPCSSRPGERSGWTPWGSSSNTGNPSGSGTPGSPRRPVPSSSLRAAQGTTPLVLVSIRPAGTP